VLVARAHLDAGVLLATAAIAIVSGLVAGALPAWFSRGSGLADALRASSRSATLSQVALRWQKAMVVAQAALSAAILAAAVLIAMSFWRLSEIPDGFSADGRVVARVVLPDATYGKHPTRAAFGQALNENLASEAGHRGGGIHDGASGGRRHVGRTLLHRAAGRIDLAGAGVVPCPTRVARVSPDHGDPAAPRSGVHDAGRYRVRSGGDREPRARDATLA
jgi:hypothetical protein